MIDSVHLVRKKQRRVAEEHSDRGEGRLIEVLLAGPGKMEVYAGEIGPGGKSHGFARHKGEEFAFILEGELKYIVGGEVYHLEAGDLIYYPSSLPHGYENTSGKTTRVLWGETDQQ